MSDRRGLRPRAWERSYSSISFTRRSWLNIMTQGVSWPTFTTLLFANQWHISTNFWETWRDTRIWEMRRRLKKFMLSWTRTRLLSSLGAEMLFNMYPKEPKMSRRVPKRSHSRLGSLYLTTIYILHWLTTLPSLRKRQGTLGQHATTGTTKHKAEANAVKICQEVADLMDVGYVNVLLCMLEQVVVYPKGRCSNPVWISTGNRQILVRNRGWKECRQV